MDKSIITESYIGGTIHDLKELEKIISDKLDTTGIGQTFNIDKDFRIENTVTAKFFVMSNDFDPVSMDELIISGRQQVVNQNTNQKNDFVGILEKFWKKITT